MGWFFRIWSKGFGGLPGIAACWLRENTSPVLDVECRQAASVEHQRCRPHINCMTMPWAVYVKGRVAQAAKVGLRSRPSLCSTTKTKVRRRVPDLRRCLSTRADLPWVWRRLSSLGMADARTSLSASSTVRATLRDFYRHSYFPRSID
jgi:hypothetical protein